MQEIDPGLLGVVVGFGPPPEIKGVAKWRLLWQHCLRELKLYPLQAHSILHLRCSF